MNKKLAVATLLAASLVVAGWWLIRGESDQPGVLEASGTVEATEAALGFQIPGRIQTVEVREGDAVESGAILASLDTRELDADIASLRAGVDQARAGLLELERGPRPQEVARAEATVRRASETWEERGREAERADRLFRGGAISREAMERAETAERVARAALDEAQESLELIRQGPRSEQVQAQSARLRQAQAALARARARQDHARITAPMSGVVALRHREPGETTAPGAPVLTLRNLADRWVRIWVPGDQVGRVHLGQRARIRGDADPDRRYSGEVYFIGSEAAFTPRNVQTSDERVRLVYPVRVRVLDDPEVDLKPGLPVDVRLEVGDGR